jgi:hypothetical protein
MFDKIMGDLKKRIMIPTPVGEIDLRSLFTGVTPEMFGAIGDGLNDDTYAIREALKHSNIIVFGNKTYKTDHIVFNKGVSVFMNKTKFVRNSINYNPNTGAISTFIIFDGDNTINGDFEIDGRKGFFTYNNNILGFANNGQNIRVLGDNVFFNGNIKSKNSFSTSIGVINCKNVHFNDLECSNSGNKDPLNVSSASDGVSVFNSLNVTFKNVLCYDNGRNGIAVFSYDYNTQAPNNNLSGNVIIQSVIAYDNQLIDIDIEDCKDILIIKVGSIDQSSFVTCNGSKNIVIQNIYGVVYGSGVSNVYVSNVDYTLKYTPPAQVKQFYLSGLNIYVKNVNIKDDGGSISVGVVFTVLDSGKLGCVENVLISRAHQGFSIKSYNVKNCFCTFSNSIKGEFLRDSNPYLTIVSSRSKIEGGVLTHYISESTPITTNLTRFMLGDKLVLLNASASKFEYFFNGTAFV